MAVLLHLQERGGTATRTACEKRMRDCFCNFVGEFSDEIVGEHGKLAILALHLVKPLESAEKLYM